MPKISKAFTVVELLIVVAVLSLILGAAILLFTSKRTVVLSADAYVHVQQEARRALDAMVKELREANNIDTELTSAGQDTPSGGATRLNFQIARGYNVTGCTPNATCWGNDTTNSGWVHYLLNGAQLVRCQSLLADTVITDFSSCRVLANNAETFGLDYVSSARTLALRLGVRRSSALLPGGSTTTGTLTTRVKLRNLS